MRDVRYLIGVLEREKAQIGVLISLQEPTQPMRTEAASAGFYKHPVMDARYPRVQLLTVGELFRGARIEYPPRTSVTFKKAPRTKGKTHKTKDLFGGG